MHTDHHVSRRVYYAIFGILILCTYLTVQIAFFDLGPFNTVAALVIAALKASLVVLFFMHVRHTPLAPVVVLGSLLFLLILITLTMGDYLTRHLLMYGVLLLT